MLTVWDKQTDINGYSAEWYLNRHKYLANEETIYLKTVNGRVTQVEGKSALASMYGIDSALPDEEFLAEYRQLIGETGEEASEEPPEDIPEEEDTDTTTYAELAQVYAEGVNSLE